MKKSVIACTSTGGLDYYNKPNNIKIVRIKIYLDEKEYFDGDTIKADDFYQILRENPKLVPKTSQPSVGEMINFFEGLYKEGYEKVFLTTISKKLSGTYNSAVLASKELENKMDIRVFDTKTVCFSEGKFALEAEKMLNEGKTFDEIEEKLTELTKNNTIFFAVDTLQYLVYNGRLSGAQAFLGNLLKVKPILQLNEDGEIVSIEKIRTTKKALAMITTKIKEYVKDRAYEAYILYTGNPTLKEHFLTVLKEDLNLENLFESPSTPVVGGHVGPDVIGIGIFLK